MYFVSHIMDLRSYLTLDRYPAKTYCHWLPLRGSSSGTVYRSLYTQPVEYFEDQMYLWDDLCPDYPDDCDPPDWEPEPIVSGPVEAPLQGPMLPEFQGPWPRGRIDFDFDYFYPNNRPSSLYWRDPRDYTEIEDFLNVLDCGYETLTVPC